MGNGYACSLSYSVSHDLRAPLRAIDGFSLALLEDCHEKLSESAKADLTRVRSATARMAHLIDDMLQLARVARSELRLDDVDLSSFARSATHWGTQHLIKSRYSS